MRLTRADQLSEPPIVGQFYLVPTIYFRGWELLAHWPVIGVRHEDAEHLNYPYLHYHVDFRFCGPRLVAALDIYLEMPASYAVARRPLVSQFGSPPPARPTLRRIKCRRRDHDYPTDRTIKAAPFVAMYESFRGQKCQAGKFGWICPHRQFSLGSIVPIDGVITCPLHGLRIDAATGICLGSKTESTTVIEGQVSQSGSPSPDHNKNGAAS